MAFILTSMLSLKDWIKNIPDWELRNTKSMPYRLQFYPGLRTPFSHSFRNTIVRDIHATSPIIRLSNATYPSAIFWAVSKIIVNSVKRVTSGAIPHIFKKVTEAVNSKPPVANGNSSTPVISKMLCGFTQAPTLHFAPCSVKFVPGSVFVVPVGGVNSFAHLCLEASTRSGMPILKVTSGDNSLIPTVADASPFNASRPVTTYSQHNQTPKAHTNQVNDFWHFVTSKYCHQVKVWKAAVKPLFRLQTLSTNALYCKTLAGSL